MPRAEALLVIASAIAGIVAAGATITPIANEPRVAHGESRSVRKTTAEQAPAAQLLGTLVQTHTDERVPLDAAQPSQERFAKLLADQVTGEHHDFEPRLLGLLRSIATQHLGARVELVSGFRSPKRNETMRKKGHHVASHSQHSLGHAVDFRIVPPDSARGLDPLVLEREIRNLGWDGGIGVYTLASDWFVHCDVGRLRRWNGG